MTRPDLLGSARQAYDLAEPAGETGTDGRDMRRGMVAQAGAPKEPAFALLAARRAAGGGQQAAGRDDIETFGLLRARRQAPWQGAGLRFSVR